VRAVKITAAAAADALDCEDDQILVASTGPIGRRIPVQRIVGSLPELADGLSDDGSAFADSILTTDTHRKVAIAPAGGASIVGVAKGAAMLAPNMATMLAFIVTDALVADDSLSRSLASAVNGSFNRISVDACESTNDSVIVFSSGRVETEARTFEIALAQVCRDLAEQIVRDAEGGSKFVRINVAGAADDEACADLGKAVAASALWRSAVHGGDPNWGRVLSALGAADRSLNPALVQIAIGGEVVFSKGEPCGSLEKAAKVMVENEFTLQCQVGNGPGRAEVLTSDLSPEYVTLNAEGTS
jgi:glutamate N-acetyltransferase/amino-acid N-acetyltransferase